MSHALPGQQWLLLATVRVAEAKEMHRATRNGIREQWGGQSHIP